MASAARALAHLDLVKIKVDAVDPAAQVRAVRSELPNARLIVDPNESWNLELLRSLQPVLAETRVDLIEQPLPAGEDEARPVSTRSRACAPTSPATSRPTCRACRGATR